MSAMTKRYGAWRGALQIWVIAAALMTTPAAAAIDNVAFQWTSLLNELWCPTGATFTSSIQAQLHLSQWHALLALRATGDCTTEDAAVAYASHKLLSHYFSWAQDFAISPLLDQQLRSWGLSARQKRLGKRLGEAVAVAVIARRSAANEFALGAVKEALDAQSRPAVGVFRYFADTPPERAVFAFDNYGLERPFVVPHALQFVQDHLRELRPAAIPSEEWDKNWKELRDLGRADWPGRTEEMKVVAHLFGCPRINNSICSREQVATAAAQASLPSNTSLYDSVVLLAKISVSIYDAVAVHIVIKYGYWFWRPVHAYPAGDPQHAAIPTWLPYRPTPPEPEYPSGTVTAVSAGARPLRTFLGKDVGFTIKGGGVFNCEQFVGVPVPDRSYGSVDEQVREAQMARLYAGAHWRKSVDDAVKVGYTVADYVERHWTDTVPSGVLPDPGYLDVHAKLPTKSGQYSPIKFDI